MGGGPVESKDVRQFSFSDLATGWSFRQSDSKGAAWLPVQKIPSTVQQDLMDQGIVKDPFFNFNELEAGWVGTESWVYRTQFNAPALDNQSKTVLVFEGLDTFAVVRLDGKVVLRSDNMYISHRVDITNFVKLTARHELEIEFDSALFKARQIQNSHADHKWTCFNGEPARLAVRKAQYHWGWDWGPLLNCAGIWKPIRLEVYTARIAELRTDVVVSCDQKSATLKVSAEIEDNHNDELRVEFKISFKGRTVSENSCPVLAQSGAFTHMRIDSPSLWMPAGYGTQDLYDVQATLFSQEKELHSESCRIGLREIQLIQENDSHGKSFYLRINGIDIFCGGSCWIPADSFLTNITPERYRAWIELMVPANQKMIRVWGGGIYEHDSFYSACDELGILVWQDFMFACGNYPCFSTFLDSVHQEAMQNVRRLRHHPSVVIFAGNNEDYQVAESAGLTYDYADKDPEHWLKTDFPARYIYEALLPDIIRKECPEIPYHPGSPWGDGKKTSDPTVGDLHQWDIWHGSQEKYQIFDSLGGRFNSEFGMQAFPHLETVKSFIQDEKDLYPQSRVMDFHNKADGHERRLATYLAENVRTATELEAYIHLTQLIQCEALTYGYRGWRKQWGEGRRCGGALVWQLNDCWPAISWSICDYYLRRKPAYYAMARCLAPVAVGARREHFDWSVAHAREPRYLEWQVWAVSSRLEAVIVDVEVRFWSVQTGREIKDRIVRRGVELTPNGTTDVARGVIDNENEVPHVLAVKMWMDGAVVARDMDWPQPLKYLHFPNRNVEVEVRGKEMHVRTERPVKCLVFEERMGYSLSDSAMDLAPNDEQVVHVTGWQQEDEPLRWTYLGAGEQ
ncbi:Beta-mannosidase B [Endocarpon pusillum Z07020]|uniref:Beta-mannosidase B n=1 Tax=Endocarpon pusillum (strain Z07020 / HMAS-L-300199) TaxID=1263415 RepID=U1G3B5_ENDPU|nr:Beta-mannosidase B [Endocarpon pusillum Z07020]ERF71787.1 Beta-mannosidase B [Endocarpon pusillum Z07020]